MQLNRMSFTSSKRKKVPVLDDKKNYLVLANVKPPPVMESQLKTQAMSNNLRPLNI